MLDNIESLCLIRECWELEETFQTHYTDQILGCGTKWICGTSRSSYTSKCTVLEKCGTADCSPTGVTIEERIGWIPPREMALDCGEKCVRKIQWLVRALCYRCFGEDCTYPHFTITKDILDSMDTNLQSVVFVLFCICIYCSPFGVIWWTLNIECGTQ